MKEIVRYGILDEGGMFLTTQSSESLALNHIDYKRGCTIVKLVGQLPEPKKMKRIAQYMLKTYNGKYMVYTELLTQEEAKQRCAANQCELIKWPCGEIIEVEE